MNKTVTVNIGGIVFHIDENAYERFKQYLEAIRGHFTTSDGRDEIMQDIESRIAEMFQERIGDIKQVITLEDVEEVTRQMGKPEDFADDHNQVREEEAMPSSKIRKRLFRNPDDKLLGGVCSGISSYFDVDPVWIRLAFAFVFFVFGSGFLIYIILWIVIPEAKTTAEKLQMRGEPITVGNIERNVREEMDQLKNRVNDLSKDGGRKAGTVVGRIFEAIGEIFKFIFIVIGKLLAVFFLFIGAVISFALFVTIFALAGFPGTHIPQFLLKVFASGSQITLAYFGIALLIGIPALMLAYLGARMLFNIRKGSRIVGFTALGLWLVGLAICSVIGMKIGREFSERGNIRHDIQLASTSNHYLHVESDVTKNLEKDYDHENDDWEGEFDIIQKKDTLYSSNVKLDIVKSHNDSVYLSEIYYSYGANHKEAVENATNIRYSFSQMDTVLRLSRYFSINNFERFRGQKVQLILKIPVGASIFMDENLANLIYDIENIQNIYDRNMLGHVWTMTDKGLSCPECENMDGYDPYAVPPIPPVPGSHPNHFHINGTGVHISDEDGSNIAIDSNGVRISEHGTDVVRIDSNGVTVKSNRKHTKNY